MARKFTSKRPSTAPLPPTGLEIDTRIAPDPLTAVLPALAALGTVASIAAVNWVAHDERSERARLKRRPSVGIRDLESCCLGLYEIFRRFNVHGRVFAGEGGPASAPMKFGVHGKRVDPATGRMYQTMMNDIASMMVLASQNSFDVMCAIEDGKIVAPEEIFFGFGEQQERLNKLLAARETLKITVETGADIASKLLSLVQQLKKHQID